MVSITLKGMDNQCIAMHLDALLDTVKDASPPDLTGALLVIWDETGAMHFRGHVPQSVQNGDSIRQIADAIDLRRATP